MSSEFLDFILSKTFIQSAKVAHVFFWMAWMAGLLYLPRIFVYHSTTVKNSEVDRYFCTMEYKLYYYIMHPSLLMTLCSGLFLSYANNSWRYRWWEVKILLMLAMIFLHFLFGYHLKQFKKEINKSNVYFRVINELPGVVFIFMTVMVILKPWKNLYH